MISSRAGARAKLPALLLAVAIAAAACGPDSPPASTAGSPSDELIVKVASYDLAVGKQRFLAGVITPDQRQIGWGRVKMRFAYLGTESNQLTGDVVSEADAEYLPIPGSIGEPPPEPKDGPTFVAGAQGRGVYAGEVDFNQAGFWGVIVEASIDGGEPQEGRAAFQVLDKHRYPAVGEDAPKTENLTISSADAPSM